MATVVDVIRFHLPEHSQCLFVANLPTTLSKEEIWSILYSAFSQYGLIHQIQLPVQQNYAFVKFYSEYACRWARQCLNQLCINGQTAKVYASRKRPSLPPTPLHINCCQRLANHYFGFNGWTTSVCSLEQVSGDAWSCEAVIHVRRWEVKSVGRGRATVESIEDVLGRTRAVGTAKKQAWNRACEEAFSRLVIAVIQPGNRLASVNVLNAPEQSITIPQVTPQINVLPTKSNCQEKNKD